MQDGHGRNPEKRARAQTIVECKPKVADAGPILHLVKRLSMSASEKRIFKARMSLLPEATVFVERFCSLHRVGRQDLLRLTLIVEELFTNTVGHGYGGESD